MPHETIGVVPLHEPAQANGQRRAARGDDVRPCKVATHVVQQESIDIPVVTSEIAYGRDQARGGVERLRRVVRPRGPAIPVDSIRCGETPEHAGIALEAYLIEQTAVRIRCVTDIVARNRVSQRGTIEYGLCQTLPKR